MDAGLRRHDGWGASDARFTLRDLAGFWIASSARLRGPPRNDGARERLGPADALV